jgi:hypothetical protein
MMKICSVCLEEKHLEDFYNEKRVNDGKQSKCKKCTLVVNKRWWDRNKEKAKEKDRAWRAKNRDYPTKMGRLHRTEVKCRAAVRRAVKSKKIIKPESCSVCGNISKLQAHHSNYNEPLNVIWVCITCHVAIHKMKRQAILEE